MWLFFRHLPDKDRQLKELMDSHAKDIQEIVRSKAEITDKHNQWSEKLLADQVTTLAATDRERRNDFKVALDLVVAHCQRESEMQREMMAKEVAEFGEALKDVRLTLESLREVLLKHGAET